MVNHLHFQHLVVPAPTSVKGFASNSKRDYFSWNDKCLKRSQHCIQVFCSTLRFERKNQQTNKKNKLHMSFNEKNLDRSCFPLVYSSVLMSILCLHLWSIPPVNGTNCACVWPTHISALALWIMWLQILHVEALIGWWIAPTCQHDICTGPILCTKASMGLYRYIIVVTTTVKAQHTWLTVKTGQCMQIEPNRATGVNLPFCLVTLTFPTHTVHTHSFKRLTQVVIYNIFKIFVIFITAWPF